MTASIAQTLVPPPPHKKNNTYYDRVESSHRRGRCGCGGYWWLAEPASNVTPQPASGGSKPSCGYGLGRHGSHCMCCGGGGLPTWGLCCPRTFRHHCCAPRSGGCSQIPAKCSSPDLLWLGDHRPRGWATWFQWCRVLACFDRKPPNHLAVGCPKVGRLEYSTAPTRHASPVLCPQCHQVCRGGRLLICTPYAWCRPCLSFFSDRAEKEDFGLLLPRGFVIYMGVQAVFFVAAIYTWFAFRDSHYQVAWSAMAAFLLYGLPPIVLKAVRSLRRYAFDINFLVVVAVCSAVGLGDMFDATLVVLLFGVAGALPPRLPPSLFGRYLSRCQGNTVCKMRNGRGPKGTQGPALQGTGTAVQYRAEQGSAGQGIALQGRAGQGSSGQGSSEQGIAGQRGALQGALLPCCAPYFALPCNAMHCPALPRNAVQCTALQCPALPPLSPPSLAAPPSLSLFLPPFPLAPSLPPSLPLSPSLVACLLCLPVPLPPLLHFSTFCLFLWARLFSSRHHAPLFHINPLLLRTGHPAPQHTPAAQDTALHAPLLSGILEKVCFEKVRRDIRGIDVSHVQVAILAEPGRKGEVVNVEVLMCS